MVNKVRKKDGSMKYPYQVIMSFADTMKFLDELKKVPSMGYIYRDNKSYGTYIWGSTKLNLPYDDAIAVCKKYIPDFQLEVTNGVYIGTYHGIYLHFSLYVAYTEFDKEV